jgi:hypothetical protein
LILDETTVGNLTKCGSANESLELTFLQSSDILHLLDTLVDIGVFAEKEVIQ